MTREEAMFWFADSMPIKIIAPKAYQAYITAIEALKPLGTDDINRIFPGCHICRNVPLDRVGISEEQIYITSSMEIPAGEEFLFCPRCGKPLTDEAKRFALICINEAMEERP